MDNNKFKDFINELKTKAIDAGLNAEEIVNTYTRRMSLGLEAGFNEDEIIDRFGNVDDILSKYINKPTISEVNETYQLKNFTLSIVDECDIRIVAGNNIDVEMDPEMADRYIVQISDDSLKIESSSNILQAKKRNYYDDLTIYLPRNCSIEKADISLVSSDLSCDVALTVEKMSISTVNADVDFKKIKAKNFKCSTVSGDVDIDIFAAIEAKIDAVSGDFKANEAAIKKLDVSTISGDIDIYGIVDEVNSSSISGDISINHQSQKTSLKDALGSFFKGF